MGELTWAQLDALEAERKLKIRELTDKLAKVLTREFTFSELNLMWQLPGDSIRIEAYEIARTNAKER